MDEKEEGEHEGPGVWNEWRSVLEDRRDDLEEEAAHRDSDASAPGERDNDADGQRQDEFGHWG